MRRRLKAIGYFVAGLIAILFALAIYSAVGRVSAIRAARKTMGRPADTLRVDGLTFRDLNKNGRLDPYEDRRVALPVRVEDLLAQMTTEEKAGLLFHTFVVPGRNGSIASPLRPTNLLPIEVALFSKKMNFFNLIFLGTAAETARWHNQVQRLAERTRLGIPATFSSDTRHGPPRTTLASYHMPDFSRWPEPIGLAAIGDSALVEEFGRLAAGEYRAVGIRVALHPMADLATEPRWARISGTFGEDASLAARLTAAYVHGFQGDSLGPTSVATVTKHFAGGGPQEDGWDPHYRYGRNQVYPGHNLAYPLIPFRAAIAAGTALIMPYYSVPVGLTDEEVGFGFDRSIISVLLRDSLGFRGIVLTDWGLLTPLTILGIEAERFAGFVGVKDYGVEGLTPAQRARKALDAGVDQFGGEMEPELVLRLIQDGVISPARLDESVRRLLALKFALGLFDDPYVDVEAVPTRVGTPAAQRLGAESQRRSQVLLTNRTMNGKAILPLTPGTRLYVENLNPVIVAKYGTVVRTVEEADVTILNLEPAFDPDRGSLLHQGRLYYTEEELERILPIMQRKPTVVTVFLERPLVMPEIIGASRAIVANFGAADDAILDVLFGRSHPEGKLPFDLPSSWEAVLRQEEDVAFDSRHPLFRFGHGLRYE